jgi:hypothetical protein
MEETLAAQTITRSALLRPYYFVLYAGALIRGKRFDDAHRALDEGQEVAEDTRQLAYRSEHQRLRAVIYAATGQREQAEAAYLQSLATAREQGARWLELRAARAYANHLAAHGFTTDAHRLLEPVLSSFTEGHGTLDYLYSDALLKTL